MLIRDHTWSSSWLLWYKTGETSSFFSQVSFVVICRTISISIPWFEHYCLYDLILKWLFNCIYFIGPGLGFFTSHYWTNKSTGCFKRVMDKKQYNVLRVYMPDWPRTWCSFCSIFKLTWFITYKKNPRSTRWWPKYLVLMVKIKPVIMLSGLLRHMLPWS